MSEKFEIREKVDYGYVINLRLSRIAEARSNLFIKHNSSPMENVRVYMDHVEALYAILLPELRDDAGKFLELANKVFFMMKDLEDIDDKNKKREIWNQISKLLDEYGVRNELKNIMKGRVFLHSVVAFIIDEALSRIIERLNTAGLLLRGRVIKVGKV